MKVLCGDSSANISAGKSLINSGHRGRIEDITGKKLHGCISIS